MSSPTKDKRQDACERTDMSSLTPLGTFSPAAQTRVWFSAPHPYLPLVASCSSDRSVRVYSLSNFQQHSAVEGGHKRSVRACAWKPTGDVRGESVLATGSFDASAGIWRMWERNTETMEAIKMDGAEDDDDEDEEWRFAVVLDGHESEIKSVAWSAGGNFLATCSRDKSVWIWEELEDDNFETIAVLQEHEADVKCVVWHPEEELLASSSYDDTIRLYKEDIDDWTCIAVLNGHESTVWAISFQSPSLPYLVADAKGYSHREAHLEQLRKSGPRLVSCSADETIRIWRRTPKQPADGLSTTSSAAQPGKPMPSIIRPVNAQNIEEDWFEETQLPKCHDRAVLSVSWSPHSGRIVSAGSDGKIVVYEEVWDDTTETNGTTYVTGKPTRWEVRAQQYAAHGVFEVNHVCWSRRYDGEFSPSIKKNRSDGPDNEMILSSGDDGVVKAWTIPAS